MLQAYEASVFSQVTQEGTDIHHSDIFHADRHLKNRQQTNFL